MIDHLQRLTSDRAGRAQDDNARRQLTILRRSHLLRLGPLVQFGGRQLRVNRTEDGAWVRWAAEKRALALGAANARQAEHRVARDRRLLATLWRFRLRHPGHHFVHPGHHVPGRDGRATAALPRRSPSPAGLPPSQHRALAGIRPSLIVGRIHPRSLVLLTAPDFRELVRCGALRVLPPGPPPPHLPHHPHRARDGRSGARRRRPP